MYKNIRVEQWLVCVICWRLNKKICILIDWIQFYNYGWKVIDIRIEKKSFQITERFLQSCPRIYGPPCKRSALHCSVYRFPNVWDFRGEPRFFNEARYVFIRQLTPVQSAYLFCATTTARIARSDPWKWQQNVINSMNSNSDNCAMSVFEGRFQIQKGLLLDALCYQRVNWLHTAWLSIVTRTIWELRAISKLVKVSKPTTTSIECSALLLPGLAYLRIKVRISDRAKNCTEFFKKLHVDNKNLYIYNIYNINEKLYIYSYPLNPFESIYFYNINYDL